MPDTRGHDGAQHFAEAARVIEETSSDSKFATREVTQGTGGDGPIVQETRGKPSLGKPTKK